MSSHWLRAPSAPLVGPSVPKTHKSNNWLEVPTTPLVWPEVPTTHFDPAARPKIQNVALHWLNRRYHVEATVPHPDPEAREWATIVYTTYQQPGGDTYVQAKFLYTRPFKPIVLRQRSRNDEDTVMVPLAGGLPDDAEVMEGTEPITIVLYEGAAGVFHVWKEGETTQSVVRFASTHAAFTAIHNWTTKQADILPVRATQVPAADTLGFRANVTLRYSARAPIFEPNPRKVMTRYLHIVVDADGDEKVTGCYKEVWSKSRLGLEWDYRIRVSEAGGYSGGDNGLIKSSVATRYRMYDWAEKKGVLLHDYPNDKWYHLDVRKRSMVSHVRAHMEFKAPMKEGDNQQWECVRTGFHAGANTVAMFVRLDENKTVRKRIVVKPTARHETDDAVDDYGQSVVPRELHLHRLLKSMKQSEFSKLLHDSYHDSSSQPFYLYIEYASFGSLLKLQLRHADAAEAVEELPDKSEPEYLPELFIWLVFRNLATAVNTLVTHELAKPGYAHVDIKPANIFITEGKKGRMDKTFEFYNDVLLADFGVYYRLEKEQIHGMKGTPGYFAPEQYGPYPNTPVRTSIFQVGLIIYSLMRKAGVGFRPDENVVGIDVPQWICNTDFANEYDSLYSQGLEELMQACLEEDVRKRPDPATLLRKTIAGLDNCDKQNGELKHKKRSELPRWMQVDFGEDAFRVGRKLEGRKRKREGDAYETIETKDPGGEELYSAGERSSVNE